ncbi:MAG: SDR family NAD(P)-dependent oxidoreductase [Propionibacteriaceae bacterium]
MTTALITGATGGIGQAFAEAFAAQGHDVILVARREEELRTLAERLHEQFRVAAAIVVADLALAEDRDRLVAAHPAVDVLVNNAGFGDIGRFDQMPSARVVQMVSLNCTAVADLASRYLPSIVERKGVLINVASTAAFQPLPNFALYAATKSFVLSLTQALWSEYKGTGVTIQALCPGPTDTSFFDVANNDEVMTQRRTPHQVIATSMAGWAKNKPVVVDGVANLVGAKLAKAAPYRAIEAVAKKVVGHG